jgi:hypothetical protein
LVGVIDTLKCFVLAFLVGLGLVFVHVKIWVMKFGLHEVRFPDLFLVSRPGQL